MKVIIRMDSNQDNVEFNPTKSIPIEGDFNISQSDNVDGEAITDYSVSKTNGAITLKLSYGSGLDHSELATEIRDVLLKLGVKFKELKSENKTLYYNHEEQILQLVQQSCFPSSNMDTSNIFMGITA